MQTDMALRIHSYSLNPDYHATIEYHRDGSWHDFSERLITNQPISISKSYRQVNTCTFVLNNNDGLLTPENQSSAYNLNGASTYDALIVPARKIRVKEGINCFSSVSETKTVTSTPSPTAGALTRLADGLYGDVTSIADADWVHWSALGSGATIVLKIDLGSQLVVQHGCISFLSKSGEATPVKLPSTVQFAYSTNDSTYVNIGSAFDMSKYSDATLGQNYLAWFTDALVTCRYIRATITNITSTNEIYIDEFAVWGGTTTTFKSIDAFMGYLGDSIDVGASSGVVNLQFRDVRKREDDNKRTELTRVYKNQRPEQIIYDLLTDNGYWTPQGTSGSNVILNPSFEKDNADWSYFNGAVRLNREARTGSYIVNLNDTDEYIEQHNVPVNASSDYVFEFWQKGETDTRFHVQITQDGGKPDILIPAVGSMSGVGNWQKISQTITTGAGVTVLGIHICGDAAHNFSVDDVALYLSSAIVTDTYDCPLLSTEIGWGITDNLTDFEVTKWQGQQGSILDYIDELAKLVGLVYDADGSGVRQFWQPPENETIAHPYMNFFAKRLIGPDKTKRTYTDEDVRNHIKIVGYETGNKEVPREYRNEQSIVQYGDRYARINEPLVKSADMSDYLGASLLRDFAFAGRGVETPIIGDFDIDRTKYICTFDEPVRTFLTKSELWTIESYNDAMCIAGQGYHKATISTKRFYSFQPSPVANVAGVGGASKIDVSWTARVESNIGGYFVYWGTSPAGPFTKRSKVLTNADSITGLTNGTTYWIYVTAVNTTDGEGMPSAIIACKAGAGNSGNESTTWDITGLAATKSSFGHGYSINLKWTPSLVYNPDSMIINAYGPSSINPPGNIADHSSLSPKNGVEISYHVTLSSGVNLIAGVTYYFMLGIKSVTINRKVYTFGSPLLSNVVSIVWS